MAHSGTQNQEAAAIAEPGGVGRRIAAAAGWLGPWVAASALALWTSAPDPRTLVLAALGVGSGVLWGLRDRGRAWSSGAVVLVVAILLGFAAHRQVDAVLADFEGYWAARDTVVGGLLEEELDRRVGSGLTATTALADAWTESEGAVDIGFVRELRARNSTSALALYDPSGALVLWDGVHRGKVPEDVQTGEQRFAYHDLPLFGYLYVTSIAGDGSVAMAAHLLRAALPESLGADVGDFASDFYDETSERIRVTEEDPGPWEGVVWDLADRDTRLLSVVVDRPDRMERASRFMDRWVDGVALLLLLAWVLLALGGPRRLAGAAVAAGTLIVLAASVPLADIAPLASVFESAGFGPPGAPTSSLGRLALLGIVAFTLVSVLPGPRLSMPPWAAGLIVAVAFPALVAWVGAGVGETRLASGRLDWVVYEIGAAALLSLVAGWVIVMTRAGKGSGALALGALLGALALSVGGAAWVWTTAEHPLWWTALWALPTGWAAAGAGAWSGWRRSVVGWLLGIVLGSSAAIPVAWAHRIDARMAVGEEHLRALGAPDDPELERALLSFSVLADSLDRAGSDDVSLLYHGWRMSGLAELGQPVWLQVWARDGTPGEDLRVGVEAEAGEPEPLGDLLQESWRAGGVRLYQLDRDDARYILTLRLADAEVVSVVAPPFVEGGNRTGLGPLAASAESTDPVTVIPLLPGDPHAEGGPTWTRIEQGWLGDAPLDFANGTSYHAHYLVTLPRAVLALARASLLLALNLMLFFGFWLVGQSLVRGLGRGNVRLSGLVISFRARVTLALFGFFALANALFGTVAYTTLESASRRSARVIAERVGEDASGWYRALGGQIERLARQVGADLVEYRDGELREGSVEALVELGLYEGWTPFAVHQRLASRESVSEFTETSLGRWEYVTAYRRLPDGDVLGAQVPLQAGTSALQTTDLVELLGFLVLVGAALSLALAMLAGRALTRPIQALQIASESVGAGDLGQRLPDQRGDEFGAVFQAFNRMVGRVRSARRQLVRTSRRTQLIMDEAAVGMVAIDPGGTVTLVNPRAEQLLGGEVEVGQPLPEEGPLGQALTPWLTKFLERTRAAADAEFQAGDRRVRVRVRRLGSFGSQRGVVIAMDDVTDELRAERVLAWGEMARQVAHEVKNPLTPIKLSIQHVRRAWEDEHPDFEEILLKNADAMLTEIDRLAGIAQSFSRFGAPGEHAVALSPVSVAEVVRDVMALYGGSAARVRFEADVDPALPRVVARSSELKEVLVNLLENARMAGGHGTLVSIAARRGDDDTVVLTVVDNGSGIVEEVLPRIFEPQFSTRSTGTGLGLAIVQRLVRAWGGTVTVDSTLGEGTSVTVTLRVWRDGGSVEGGSAGTDPAS